MKQIVYGAGFLLLLALALLDSQPQTANGQATIPHAGRTLYLPALHNTFDCREVTEIPQRECEALEALWWATNPGLPYAPVSWHNTDGWLVTNEPCSWYGIECTEGHVTRIDLFANFLVGGLPPEIGDLSNLQTLQLHGNQLSSLPAELGNLANLQWLNLFGNQVSILPAEIGNLANLEFLDLYHNQLSTLPAEIANLTNLRNLNVAYNQLTSLPKPITQLTQLTRLDIGLNCLVVTDPEIVAFLDARMPGWQATQRPTCD